MEIKNSQKIMRAVIFTACLVGLLVIVFPVAAQIGTVNATPLGLKGGSDLAGFIRDIGNALLALIGLIATIFLVYAGVRYITSAGDEKKAESAKHTILYAIIGLIVIGVSTVLVNYMFSIITGVGYTVTP